MAIAFAHTRDGIKTIHRRRRCSKQRVRLHVMENGKYRFRIHVPFKPFDPNMQNSRSFDA